MLQLTAEQKARIEENRQGALAIRAHKLQQQLLQEKQQAADLFGSHSGSALPANPSGRVSDESLASESAVSQLAAPMASLQELAVDSVRHHLENLKAPLAPWPGNSTKQNWISWLDPQGNLVMAERQTTEADACQGS